MGTKTEHELKTKGLEVVGNQVKIFITTPRGVQTIFEQWNKLTGSLCNYMYMPSNHYGAQEKQKISGKPTKNTA